MKFRYETQEGAGFVVTTTPAGNKVPVLSIPTILNDQDQAAIGAWAVDALNSAHDTTDEVAAISKLDNAAEMIQLRQLLGGSED